MNMERMKYFRKAAAISMMALPLLCSSCTDTEPLERDLDRIELKMRNVSAAVKAASGNVTALEEVLSGKVYIVDCIPSETGYAISFSDGRSAEILFGHKMTASMPLVGVSADGKWTMSVDGGVSYTEIPGCSPVHGTINSGLEVGVGDDGCWRYSTDGGASWKRIEDAAGKPMSATDGTEYLAEWSFFDSVTPDENGSVVVFTLKNGSSVTVPVLRKEPVEVAFSQGTTIRSGETLSWQATVSGVAAASFVVPSGWKAALTDEDISFTAPEGAEAGSYGITLAVTTDAGLLRNYTFNFTYDPSSPDISTCKTWNDFASGSPANILPDFSWAGYDHGLSAPPDVWGLGYTVYNVCDYGAVPNDGKNDREAVIKCLTAAFGSPSVTATYLTFTAGADARKIIYFPEGEYILYTDDDKVYMNADGHPDSQTLRVNGSRFVLKGAGRDKTRIVMDGMLLPQNHANYTSPSTGMYSSSWLFSFIGTTIDSASDARMTTAPKVAADASRGDFTVTLASAGSLKAGDWVCLRAVIADKDYITAEFKGLTPGSSWDILTSGISLREYHQIKSVSGNKVTFVEPLMHDIDASKDFYLPTFTHGTGIGVEDITFVGRNVNDFVHHGSWIPDGAYKPLIFYYCTDSWLRRCDFEGVSEVCSMTFGANNSMYDIGISGWRGHNNARVGRQSFTFIGKVTDTSDGLVHSYNPAYSAKTTLYGAGSYHGPGLSYESCANVIWRCVWGKDAGFESHGRQSRVSLFDCCEGGFLSHRQGGGVDDMPNHMGDLVFWNFNSTNSWPGSFSWWSASTAMYVIKPILVGMHGGSVTSDPSTITVDESNGSPVDIGSLYEAQLRKRLGAVPAWVNSLK